MAKGIKTGGRDFEVGNKANPYGRPAVPEDIKEIRSFNQFELERIINTLLDLKPGELTTQIKSGGLSCKEMMIATIISKAIVQGDHHRLEFILNRLIGKVTDRFEHTGKGGGPIAHSIENTSDANLERRYKELESKIETKLLLANSTKCPS